MGNTTRKAIKTDKFSEPTQIRASMTKEATGTDFIRDISGSSKSLKRGKRHAAPPARMHGQAYCLPRKKPEKDDTGLFSREGCWFHNGILLIKLYLYYGI